ncbi:Uma2 family endonuclease [Corallococcus exiguus]|nr:Uma2 family endonuclease [Corallococcus exiguus]
MGDETPQVVSDYPRAPSQEAWDAMDEEERAQVEASLPNEVTWNEMPMPEGDWHTGPRTYVWNVLRRYWAQQSRRAYVSSALPIYYPEEPRFAPDLLVVLDAEQRTRDKWVCSAEAHGLDWVMEVHAGGDRKTAAEANVQRYARLGIPEYFILDGRDCTLECYQLETPDARVYTRLEPQRGRYVSKVLGLEFQAEGERLQLWTSATPLLTYKERVLQLEAELQRREGLERRLKELEAELARLKKSQG